MLVEELVKLILDSRRQEVEEELVPKNSGLQLDLNSLATLSH